MDQAQAGRGYVPEACVLLFRFAFEEIGLHRLQISIIPRNRPSRRVAQKLWLRGEGIALPYWTSTGAVMRAETPGKKRATHWRWSRGTARRP